MDAAADDASAFAHRAKAGRNQRADRCEQDHGVEFLRRRLIRSAGPDGAERAGEILRDDISRAREGIDLLPAMTADLRGDMRGGAEPIEAYAIGGARGFQASPADQTRAQQRRCGDGVGVVGQRKQKSGFGDHMRGEAAVTRRAVELAVVAEILAAFVAIEAMAARMGEPGRADALAKRQRRDARAEPLDAADDFMPRHDRQSLSVDFIIDDMQIGTAHAAGLDADQRLTGPQRRPFAELPDERSAERA